MSPLPIFSNKELIKAKEYYKELLNKPVSFLFVTYNRCPSKVFEDNPLTWSFVSLLNSNLKVPDEFIVVIDGSTDFTEENLNWIKNKFDINLKIIKNDQRKGCSYSRKVGIENISNEWFFMGDDDCLYKPDFIWGSLVTFQLLNKQNANKLAVLNLPVFEMDTDFRGTSEIEEIGKVYFETAWFYHNFDKFPLEYKSLNGIYIDKNNLITKPLEIDTFKGITLNSKRLIMDVGNFLDLSMWSNDYSEHIELSYRLQNNRYKMFYLPDARISCTHLRFGTKNSAKLHKNLKNVKYYGIKYTLEQIREISNNASINTGCRVTDQEFVSTRIGSFLSFFLKVSYSSALYFAKIEYENFVDKNLKSPYFPFLNVDKKHRFQIWNNSILKALQVTQDQTSKDYSDFYLTLKNILKF